MTVLQIAASAFSSARYRLISINTEFLSDFAGDRMADQQQRSGAVRGAEHLEMQVNICRSMAIIFSFWMQKLSSIKRMSNF